MDFAERLARCDKEIEDCRRRSGDPADNLITRIGAQQGELDWLITKQLLEEEYGT